MLVINVGAKETWNPFEEKIVMSGGEAISMEHSLWAMSEWEASYKKPFPLLNGDVLGGNELIVYIMLMAKDKAIDPKKLSEQNMKDIVAYLSESRTATVITPVKDGKPKSSAFTTTETIYATMCNAQIPWEAENWNFTRLSALIGVIAERNKEKKPMKKNQILKQNAELNRLRREQMKSKG